MTPTLIPASAQILTDPVTLGRLAAGADLAVIILAILALGASIWSFVLTRRYSRLGGQIKHLLGDITHKVDPVIERSKVIAQNVEYISASVRSDVERVTGSVQALSDRLQQASDRMEERIEDFNALMEVVQGEAEETFIDTASTVRGVRAGARELAAPRNPTEAAASAPRRSAVTTSESDQGDPATDGASEAS